MNGFLLCGSRVKLSWGKSTQAIQRPVGPPPPEYYQAATGGYGYAQQQGGFPQQQAQQGYASSLPGTPLTPTMGGDYSGQQYQQQQQQHNPQGLHQAYYSPSGAHPPVPVAPPVQDPRTVIPVSEANAKFLDEREAVEAGTWVSSTWVSQ